MTNRLRDTSSPYLRQHAGNPVAWQPWDTAALAEAREHGKPILLSIGYSACHWCHVMAHESFEDEATARLMNALYVNIKVDREERPDLDKIYQLAHQALSGRGGGWPLTVFLTPDDLMPFYAGTYFPPEPRHGMPPFSYVLQQVHDFWTQRRDDVRAQNRSLAEFLAESTPGGSDGGIDDGPLRDGLRRAARAFDPVNGGHSGGPKFPHCGEIELHLDAVAADDDAMARAYHTLQRMAQRGLCDHLGGGFFRYCVDARWEIPHFEKMLYDNAQLLPLYARGAVAFDEPGFAAVVEGIVSWLDREMTAPDGTWYSALDADSEGEEGRYYIWQRDEIRALLDPDAFAIVERRYALNKPPNFEGHAWHLVLNESRAEIAHALGTMVDIVATRLDGACSVLFDARARRVRPGLDDKVLTSWNALMIGGLARSARYLQRDDLHDRAARAVASLRGSVWIDGRLYACHAGGRAQFPAYLDDHAFLLDALLDVMQGQWTRDDFDWAMQLADGLLAHFEDHAHGGFFFTAHDHETLPHRPKPVLDESLPAGNAIAARALLRLGHVTGMPRYVAAAERALRFAWPTLQQLPHACASMLRVLNDYLLPRTQVVVRHDRGAVLDGWRAAMLAPGALTTEFYFIPSDEAGLPGSLGAQAVAGTTAFVCRGTSCLAPITEPHALLEAIA